MSDQSERVGAACPSCSPTAHTAHELLTTGGGRATIRCEECSHVHKEQLPDDDTVERTVIVSQDGESQTAAVSIDPEEQLETGEEFVLETDEAIMEVRITDLELGAQQRREEATAEAVETIWTRAVDNVSVNVTINPTDGSGESRSVSIYLPGDHKLRVGDTESQGEEEFSIVALGVREEASGYNFETLDHDGDVAFARDVKRVYATDEGASRAWSAW